MKTPTLKPTKKTAAKKAPDRTDRYVGHRLRLRREALGMSQSELGTGLGVTFQQVQKYEKGMNRISAGRLQQASRMLSAPLSYFYDGYIGELSPGFAEASTPLYIPTGDSQTEDGRRLMRAFHGIADPAVRQKLVELAEAFAAGGR